ncbi:iron complex transport system permease protein [Evansella caseinilytica]|uniref:Iron complex transport system permease protein n=1 Tax=Evansella caseinilytica TaxID=1503961 RepID=A0A1H3UHD3_9BACI|nr:iron ABC transporter permease [Evansella caseinilytica]SDZ61828.1 iron complex transport system permease protein [Evansella caseinilytica]
MSSHGLKKSFVLLTGGFFLLCLLSLVHLTQGQADYSVSELMAEVWSEGRVQDIVLSLRLPRLVIGILAGGALAVAGAAMQTLTRNPLASPGTLGVNAGAFFFVVAAMVFFPGFLGQFPFLTALMGAALSSCMVIVLAGRQMEPVRVALTGMIISLFFSSVTGALQLLFENKTNGLFLWGSGTLIQLNWQGVSFAGPVIALALVGVLMLARPLDTFSLGEDIASSLGQNVSLVKLSTWSVAIVLSAVTVSVVGPIGFIGLMAPHIVRMLGMKGHLLVFVHSFLWGAIMLVGADVLGRFIQPGQEVPVGAMTALIGGPWLLYLAWRAARSLKRSDKQMGGTTSPVSLKIIVPVIAGLISMMVVVAFSFNGSVWSFDWTGTVMWNFRIPRVITAFFVGALLAITGVLLQGILRNPLADASVIGVTSMSGAGAMLLLVLFPSIPIAFLPLGGVFGAALALGIILITAWKNNFQPMLVALMGIAIAAFGSAVIQVFVVKAKLAVAAALVWLSGSTYGKGWDDVQMAVIMLAVFIVPAIYVTRELDALTFGDDVAAGLGLSVRRARVWTLVLGVALSAAAVSLVGTIGFIGLVAPHIARRLVGFRHLPLMIVSSMLGGLLLVTADFIGRVLIAPKEIPSGLVVALIGTPYLLYLLRKI